ncbi:hypothetical protein Pcinc_028030 [Petrolisthes cinctipes]|uniref:Ferritin n=1 Tax=Petrolisthes cinctipes TaxID=88211 RepID=A0AAE1K7U8_PETCI|nr:hypothetical protein Pcinc_028030 [Petrolisthes cinctipes]
MASQVRQNFHEDCEAAINKYINTELHASYTFLSMSYYFDRDDVALPGLCKYLKTMSDSEYNKAHTLMKYQNERGGRVVLQSVACPARQEWGEAVDTLQASLDIKKHVNKEVLDLHTITSERNDGHATHFIDDNLLEFHVDGIQELADMLTRLRRAAGEDQLGLYVFDKELL